MSTSSHTRLIGIAGTYALVKLIDKRGNGEVWRAFGPSGEVAVKLLKNGNRPPDAAARFGREIERLIMWDTSSIGA